MNRVMIIIFNMEISVFFFAGHGTLRLPHDDDEWQTESITTTVVPVMNGHPRDQAKVSVHCRWALIRGNLTLKCVSPGIDNVAVQGRWQLTTGVSQGRYYCITLWVVTILTSSII